MSHSLIDHKNFILFFFFFLPDTNNTSHPPNFAHRVVEIMRYLSVLIVLLRFQPRQVIASRSLVACHRSIDDVTRTKRSA